MDLGFPITVAHHLLAHVLIIVNNEHNYFTLPLYFLVNFFTHHRYIVLHAVYRLIYMKINKIKEK